MGPALFIITFTYTYYHVYMNEASLKFIFDNINNIKVIFKLYESTNHWICFVYVLCARAINFRLSPTKKCISDHSFSLLHTNKHSFNLQNDSFFLWYCIGHRFCPCSLHTVCIFGLLLCVDQKQSAYIRYLDLLNWYLYAVCALCGVKYEIHFIRIYLRSGSIECPDPSVK